MASIKKVAVALVMILGWCWIVYLSTPNLIADARTNDWVPALGLKTEKAKCTVSAFVISLCEISYRDVRDPAGDAISIHHFVYGSWGNEQFMLMRSASHPEIVSTSVGIRDLNERLITMAGWLGLGLLAIFAIARSLLRRRDGVAEPDMVPAASIAARPPAGSPPGFGRRGVARR